MYFYLELINLLAKLEISEFCRRVCTSFCHFLLSLRMTPYCHQNTPPTGQDINYIITKPPLLCVLQNDPSVALAYHAPLR